MDSMPLLVLRAVAAEGKQDAPPVEAASVAELVGGAIVAAAMVKKFFLFMLVTVYCWFRFHDGYL